MSNEVISLSFAQSAGGGSLVSTLVMFAAMFAILYFILIRPQQKQQKKHLELLAALKKGDEVILSSGIMGRVFAVEDKIVIIEIGEKTRLRVLKQAVQALITPSENEQGPSA
jgi:preprotein translocase subunit YajC